jgi:hypothetical protein
MTSKEWRNQTEAGEWTFMESTTVGEDIGRVVENISSKKKLHCII